MFATFKKIDMHSHIGTWGVPFNIHIDAQNLVHQMEEYNIVKTVLCSSNSSNNKETLQAYRQYPTAIIPIARIDCSKGKKAYDELEHYIRDEHFEGGKIQSLFDGYAADAPCVDPAAEICAYYGKPFFVHSGHAPFSLPWQIGLLAERHPTLKICMLHMGHGNGIYVDAALTMAKRYSNIWLETSGTSMSVQIRNAYENVAQNKIMFGLDTPFHAPSVEIQKIQACGIDEEGMNRIFYKNACEFMNIEI